MSTKCNNNGGTRKGVKVREGVVSRESKELTSSFHSMYKTHGGPAHAHDTGTLARNTLGNSSLAVETRNQHELPALEVK